MKQKLKWIIIRLPELVAALALLVAISITSVNAFSRYLLKTTYAGSDEIVCIAFVWLVFCGAAAAFRRKMHFGIDLLLAAFPERVQEWLGILTQLLITVIIGVLAYLSIVLTSKVGGKIMTATHISYVFFDLAAVVGFSLMFIYSVWFLVKAILKQFKGCGEAGAAK